MKSKYEKLMAYANDPAATPAERDAYRRKAEAIGKPTDDIFHNNRQEKVGDYLRRKAKERAAKKDWIDDIREMHEQEKRQRVWTFHIGPHGPYDTAPYKINGADSVWTWVRWVDANGKAVETSCCCTRAGSTRKECGQSRNLKNPCACSCHRASMKRHPMTKLETEGG